MPTDRSLRMNVENLNVVRQHEFVLNLYQAQMVNNFTVNRSALTAENWAETTIFDLPQFQQYPLTWAEASDRFPYVAMNWNQVDVGNPQFGDVSIVFNHSRVGDAVQITPSDTGIWEMFCNSSKPAPFARTMPITEQWSLPINCSVAWPIAGTLQHWEHLFLPHLGLWGLNKSSAEATIDFFTRGPLAGPYPQQRNITQLEQIMYFESDIIANVPLQEGVKFVIGSFPSLFGTALGAELRAWCTSQGWALIWAMGLTPGDKWNSVSTAMNQRLLDGITANGTNATGAVPAENWAHLWGEAEKARQQPWWDQPSDKEFNGWWDQLASAGTVLAPLSARSCSMFDRCVGVTIQDGDCVCYMR